MYSSADATPDRCEETPCVTATAQTPSAASLPRRRPAGRGARHTAILSVCQYLWVTLTAADT